MYQTALSSLPLPYTTPTLKQEPLLSTSQQICCYPTFGFGLVRPMAQTQKQVTMGKQRTSTTDLMCAIVKSVRDVLPLGQTKNS